ncbi:MAG: twin-arginine translocase subunit TatB [Ferrovum sp.]|nr:twin-arginine translocase subunit TatB [Ferrovum sp.]NDU87572.1 twin-arginine translocase subunit TatB [Ferrovum sp.]
MLDFSFSEVGLVGLVALIAIGPERMPKVARSAGILFGRFRRYTQSVKAELDKELHLAEMREVEKKIAEAHAEVARQVAASSGAVNEVLSQPLLSPASAETGGVAAAQTITDKAEGQELPVSAVATVDAFLVDKDTVESAGLQETLPKVGFTFFGGDPFSVRRSAPPRSLPRVPQEAGSQSVQGEGV